MAVQAVQITEDEFNAAEHDDPNFTSVPTHVPGVGSITTYWRKEHVDDLTGKPAADVHTVKFAAPFEVIETEEDDEGEETEVTFYRSQAYEIDLGKASLTKLVKALAPFVDKARESYTASVAPTSTSTRSTANPKLTEWNRRAKAWLRDAGHEVKDRGRLPNNLEEIYVKNHPDDPKPE